MQVLIALALVCASPSIEQATVKIVVRIGSVQDYGSGTVCSINGQTYIVTCAHLFDEKKPHDGITVTLYGGRKVEAKLLKIKHKADVAILSADVRGISPVQVARNGYRPPVGQPITVAGHDLGGPFNSWSGQVTAINRCVGYENIECLPIPENGRSGGGMFADGKLIGICSGVNPVEEEGIYGSVSEVWELLGSQPVEPPRREFAPSPQRRALEVQPNPRGDK